MESKYKKIIVKELCTIETEILKGNLVTNSWCHGCNFLYPNKSSKSQFVTVEKLRSGGMLISP